MDSIVIAVRENRGGRYVGFLLDHEFLECSECREEAEYRLRYTENEERNLAELRQIARRMIEEDHPAHRDEFRVR